MIVHQIIDALRLRHDGPRISLWAKMINPDGEPSSPTQIREEADLWAKVFAQSQKFDFGILQEIDYLPICPDAFKVFNAGILKLPFETCVFEHQWDRDGCRYTSLFACKQDGGSILVSEWVKRGVYFEYPACVIRVSPEADHNNEPLYEVWATQALADEAVQEIAMGTPACALSLLLILNTRGVERISQPAPAALNKHRERKGRCPLFAHTIVKIGDALKAMPKGTGHHSSPRMHLRRGHIRRLGDDKTVWVRPCVVAAVAGNGVVTHDYVVNAGGQHD